MAKVIIIDDDPAICRLLSEVVGEMGHEHACALNLGQGLRQVAEDGCDVVLLDLNLPDGHGLQALPQIAGAPCQPEVIIVTGEGDARGAELAFNNGAWDFIQKPFGMSDVALPLERALQFRRERLAQRRARQFDHRGIVGQSSAMRAALAQAAQAAASQASLLITGETGTGKELFARAIHHNSASAGGSFVVVDCSAMPETLVESILFGHSKGAFTGADQDRQGLVAQADGGTLFLDEIGELPLAVQKSFLRVLQEQRFRPVGGRKEEESHFRLISATNRDLPAMVERGEFREDLFFRVQALTLQLPPLRQRGEDIKELVFHQLSQLARRYRQDVKGFSPEVLAMLMEYAWPGNVRELFNMLDSALAAAGEFPTLYPKHLPTRIRLRHIGPEEEQEPPPLPAAQTPEDDLGSESIPPLKEYRAKAARMAEDRYLRRLMALAAGDMKKACDISGLSLPRLYGILRELGIPIR